MDDVHTKLILLTYMSLRSKVFVTKLQVNVIDTYLSTFVPEGVLGERVDSR